MDTVHDMGGMHGFGQVDAADAAPFHAGWEKRALGLRLAMNLAGRGGGELRPHIEALPAAVYLSSRYYERWARGLASLVVASGLLTEAEIEARAHAQEAAGEVSRVRSGPSTDVVARLSAGVRGAANPATPSPGRFAVGDRVRVRRMSPAGHTRCPRYARGAMGTVERVTGGFELPDHPGDHRVEQTYTIHFDMRDLWGDDAERGVLYLDLWERYLE